MLKIFLLPFFRYNLFYFWWSWG